MARPFARNITGAIAGTQQIGNIAAGTPNAGFATTGLKWYNGPDESLGYVICGENLSGGTAPDGSVPNIQFWRATANTDAAFLQLANHILQNTYADATTAFNMLTASERWTNFVPPVPALVINGANLNISPSLANASGTITVNTAGATMVYRTYAGYGDGASTFTNLTITGLSGYNSSQSAVGAGNHTDQVITFPSTGTFNWTLNLTSYTISSGSGGAIALT